MKKIAKSVLFAGAAFAFVGMLLPARAQNLLPPQITDIFGLLGVGGSGAAGFVTSRIQLGLVLALGAVVLISVVYAILAAFKYIQSQGDSGKIEEAQKAIKAIFFGIAAMLIAVVGIVLVFVFFGASRPNPELTQVCLSAPGSKGCNACKTLGIEDTGCKACEDIYTQVAAGDVDLPTDGPCIEPLKGGDPLE